MASGVALRESVKEMKRLKNEPLLMLAIIAIILFVGFFLSLIHISEPTRRS